MRLIVRLLLSCLLLPALPLHAEVMDGLYRVSEPVASAQPEDRDPALQAALGTLLQRLTGDPRAIDAAGLAEVRQNPQQLIVQYGFEDDQMRVQFDPQAVSQAMRRAGLDQWGANRPALLVWWLAEDEQGSNLVADGQQAARAVRQGAQHRGLPVRLPLADLQEQLAATPEALADPGQALAEVAGRYDADGQLGVYARHQGETWQASWALSLGDEQERGELSAENPQALSDALFAELVKRLAPRYRVSVEEGGPLVVEINGVDLSRYAQVQQLLDAFGARLLAMDGERLLYRVSASREQLRAQLGLAHLRELPAEPQPVVEASSEAPLPGEAAPAADEGEAPADAGAQAAEPKAPEQSQPDMRFGW